MASIQQLQVTVLPAAVALPVNGHASLTGATTHDASANSVSLLGGPLVEQDIAELASDFSDSGSDMGSDTSSGDSGQPGFGFAQTMASAHADKANLSKTTPTTAAQSMSDTYDQLSDKLSTEMAARIHKQLSDGQWKMKFGLRPENLGGVEIQLEMKDGKLDAVFRADNPLTRDLLQNSSQRLRDALENFGIQAGLVHVGQDGGAAQQRQSGHANNPGQFGHNSGSQLSNDADVPTNTDNVRNKANASLLDLYA
jgi:flagellar hook-length control protein FliK